MMLNRLINLYRTSNNLKTPLEDFTTEAFVGVLESSSQIEQAYIRDFLKLPIDKYRLSTQRYFNVLDGTNCIIDIVIEGSENICFIENKVNSYEGHRQLEEYGNILKNNFPDMHTFLFYCTKFYDQKEYNGHNFRQHRWHDIAQFLNGFKENELCLDFIDFLISHNMAIDTTFNANDFIVFAQAASTFQKNKEVLDSVKQQFENLYCTHRRLNTSDTGSKIVELNCFRYLIKDFIAGSGNSELSYGFFYHQAPSLYLSLYCDAKNEHYNKLDQLRPLNRELKDEDYGFGKSIYFEMDLSQHLNNPNCFSTCSEWLLVQFKRFDEILKESKLGIFNY